MSDYSGDLERRLMRGLRRGGGGTDYSLPQGAPVGQFQSTESPFPAFRLERPGSIGVRPDYSPERPDLMIIRSPFGSARGAVRQYRVGGGKKRGGAAGGNAAGTTAQQPSVLTNDLNAVWAETTGTPVMQPSTIPGPSSNIATRKLNPPYTIPGLGNGPRRPPPGIPYSRLSDRKTINAKNLPKEPTSPPPLSVGLGPRPAPMFPPGPTSPWPRSEWPGFPAPIPGLGTTKARPPKGVPYSRLSDRKTINAKNLPKEPPAPTPTRSAFPATLEEFAEQVAARPRPRPVKGVPYSRLSDKKTINAKNLPKEESSQAPTAQASPKAATSKKKPEPMWWLSQEDSETEFPQMNIGPLGGSKRQKSKRKNIAESNDN